MKFYKYVLGLFVVLALSGAGVAHADVYSSDYSQASSGTGQYTTIFDIGLGTGYSGVISDIKNRAYGTMGSSRWDLIYNVVTAYTDSSYTTQPAGDPTCSWTFNLTGVGSFDGLYDISNSNNTSVTDTAGGCTANPAYYYTLTMTSGSHYYFYGPTQADLYGSNSVPSGFSVITNNSNIAFPFFDLVGWSGGGPPDYSTHIISTIPTDGATVATTTTLGSAIYVNASDYVSNMVLHVDMYNQTVAAVSANAIDACNVFGAGQCSMDFLVTAAGNNSFSATTTFNYAGTVHATWSIEVPTFWSSLPIIGGIFEPSVLYSTSTTFIVGQSTGLDTAITQGGAAVTNYLLTGTTTVDVVNCNTLSFSITSCLVSLIVPNSAAIGTFLNGFQGSFLQKVPFGYVTRFMAILTSTATSSLPSLVVTMPAGLPVAGESVDLTPWNDLFTGSSVLNTATSSSDGKTLRQAVEPDWDFFVLFCFGIAVIFELLGVAGRTNTGAGNHGGKRTEYISTEWVNRNTRH